VNKQNYVKICKVLIWNRYDHKKELSGIVPILESRGEGVRHNAKCVRLHVIQPC